jgi:hypothetical protein
MEEQRCSKCKEVKGLDQFNTGNKKNGKSSFCKTCDSKRGKEYYNLPENKKRFNELEYARRRANPEKTILRNIKNRANRSGIEFNLTIEDCNIPEICPVLGIPISYGVPKEGNGKISDNSASVDRVDNTKGYIKGNVRIISYRANHIKTDATLQELEAIVKYIKENT